MWLRFDEDLIKTWLSIIDYVMKTWLSFYSNNKNNKIIKLVIAL